jgi:hypothetical protein
MAGSIVTLKSDTMAQKLRRQGYAREALRSEVFKAVEC